jgi:hypothetical protein
LITERLGSEPRTELSGCERILNSFSNPTVPPLGGEGLLWHLLDARMRLSLGEPPAFRSAGRRAERVPLSRQRSRDTENVEGDVLTLSSLDDPRLWRFYNLISMSQRKSNLLSPGNGRLT